MLVRANSVTRVAGGRILIRGGGGWGEQSTRGKRKKTRIDIKSLASLQIKNKNGDKEGKH